MKKICSGCGTPFDNGRVRGKFCGQTCYGRAKSREMKGKPCPAPGFPKGYIPANKGKRKPDNFICPACGKTKRLKPSHLVKNRFCSIKCRMMMKPKSDNKLRANIRRLAKYIAWREAVIKKDDGKCQKCGKKGVDVDHFPRTFKGLTVSFNIKSSADAEAQPLFWDVRNGRLLCKRCHRNTLSSKNKRYSIRNTTVCVTGGAGMIGSHLVEELLDRGNHVIVLDNLSSGKREYIDPRAKFIWWDVRHETEQLAKILDGVDFVFHLVSLPFIPDCFSDPKPFFDVNAGGTMNMLRACELAGVKKTLIYSSAEIYGYRPNKITEEDELYPQSTYGVAKIAADRLSFIRYAEVGLPVVINRQFNVISWRARHPYIIPELISQLSKSSVVHLGNIASIRDFLYVGDAVKMAIELLENGICGEVYNVGADRVISIEELAKLVGKVMGHKRITIKIDKSRIRPWDINRLQSDNTKLYNTITYRPETSLEDGLRKLVEEYKKNNGWSW